MTHTIEFVYCQLSVFTWMHFRLYNSHRPSHLPTVEWQKSPEPLQMPMAVNEMTKATPSPMLRIRLLKWVTHWPSVIRVDSNQMTYRNRNWSRFFGCKNEKPKRVVKCVIRQPKKQNEIACYRLQFCWNKFRQSILFFRLWRFRF